MVRILAIGSLLLLIPSVLRAAPTDAETFFEKKVRPLLVERCLTCHSAEKPKGGLRLDSRAALIAGGDRGPAIVSGKPTESLLIRAIGHDDELKMPQKTKLPAAEIAVLTEWVRLGAPWPAAQAVTPAPPTGGERTFTAAEKAFWAFQPVKRPAVPAIRDAAWVKNPIDAFVLHTLRAAGLRPAPDADTVVQLRRLTFDLTGLPPTLDEIDAFVKDASPDAYAKAVERLLASPAYGEKWGRRWLDVARYADSNGMDENLAHANAWRYRDWVIRSFNADVPYDRFVRDQIAGDLILGGTHDERVDRLTATGFLVFGPKMLAEDDPMKMRMDIIDEQLDTVGQAFLGLTLGCARCHDHKFDPITAADYYGLAGLFYSTKSMRSYSVVAQWHERPVGTASEVAAVEAYNTELAPHLAVRLIANKPVHAAVIGSSAHIGFNLDLKARTAAMEKARAALPEAMAVEDNEGQDLRIHLRGSHLTLGTAVPRRFPRILASDRPLSLGTDRSGRLEFAEWVTRPDHPLTARVMANRIWAGHFGAGLVRTPDNFGRLGERPTHPELLDWLAAEFVQSGWSVKHLHRLIVSSAAYRMNAKFDPAAFQTDPENRLLWRFNRRRLDAEEYRDGMLATAGLLDRTMGGTLLTVNNRAYVTSTVNKNYEGYASTRRSVYLPVIRSAVFDVFQTLDFPDPSVPNGQRATTTIPTQALLLLNSPLADRSAEALAKVVLAQDRTDADRILYAYRRVIGRAPTAAEVGAVQDFLRKSEADGDSLRAWRGFCRVLFASNEFAIVE